VITKKTINNRAIKDDGAIESRVRLKAIFLLHLGRRFDLYIHVHAKVNVSSHNWMAGRDNGL
jgi:hypothetical protein